MAFLRCWCGHYDDQHELIAPSDEGHDREFGRCLVYGTGVPACGCKKMKTISGAPEGTDIYRDDDPIGYHVSRIEKGVLGELSKVREELEELIDAESQGAAIMELCEASDLVGALMAWLETHHPTYTIHDLVKMAELTSRAFESGRRK